MERRGVIRRNLAGLGLAAIAISAAFGTEAADLAGPSANHCLPSETVIYTCALQRKVASVCADATRISYRYGTLGSPELTISSDGRDDRVHVGAVVGGGSGGGATNLRFTSGRYNYVVHSAMLGPLTEAPGKVISGVTVMQGQDRSAPAVADLICRKGPHLDRLRTKVPAFVPAEPDERWDAWY